MTARRSSLVPLLTVFAMIASLGTAIATADPPPSARASDGTFSSMTIITEDKDWADKWDKPQSHVPNFGVTDGLGKGEKGILLIFVAGLEPRMDRLQAMCSIDIHKPDGSSQRVPEQLCYDDRALGQEKNVLLANARVEIVVEPTDPAGVWRFSVGVRDVNSSAKVTTEVGVRIDPKQERR